MTATVSKTYDVFISHAASETEIAAEIAESLESAGLATFHMGIVQAGADISEAVWQALAESRALIAIVSPDVLAHSKGMVEIGAASAWNKPVFILINGPSSTRLPPALSRYPVYPLGRLEEVIRAIRSGFEPLSDDQRAVLAEVYRIHGTPAEQLSQSPGELREVTSTFNRRTGKSYSGERLLSELLRMRKQGQLPRLQNRG